MEKILVFIINLSEELPLTWLLQKKKEGSSFDLPIAIGVLSAQGDINQDHEGKYLITGELALDG